MLLVVPACSAARGRRPPCLLLVLHGIVVFMSAGGVRVVLVGIVLEKAIWQGMVLWSRLMGGRERDGVN